jgi:hypothetical protein
MPEDSVYTGQELTKGGYVASSPDQATFRERLEKRFSANDFVRVINPDSEEFTWQALDPKTESYFIDRGPMKNTSRGNPRLYRIGPGQSLVLEGWNAQLMIEKLYRKLKAKIALSRRQGMSPDEAVKSKLGDIPINWADGDQQEAWIDRIFVSVENPSFGTPSYADGKVELPTTQKPVDVESELKAMAKELGVET